MFLRALEWPQTHSWAHPTPPPPWGNSIVYCSIRQILEQILGTRKTQILTTRWISWAPNVPELLLQAGFCPESRRDSLQHSPTPLAELDLRRGEGAAGEEGMKGRESTGGKLRKGGRDGKSCVPLSQVTIFWPLYIISVAILIYMTGQDNELFSRRVYRRNKKSRTKLKPISDRHKSGPIPTPLRQSQPVLLTWTVEHCDKWRFRCHRWVQKQTECLVTIISAVIQVNWTQLEMCEGILRRMITVQLGVHERNAVTQRYRYKRVLPRQYKSQQTIFTHSQVHNVRWKR